MKRTLTSLCFLSLITAAPLTYADAERTMLVIDASGSMWGQLEGRTKIEIARDAMKTLVKDWPEGREAGLVAYGHRKKGDCSDIETLVPIGPLDPAQMTGTVDKLNPKGKTPLSAAVKQAAEALKYTEEKATVVLLSDGKETCNMDPCALGSELEKLGVDFTAHVIGFDVKKSEEAGLRCLAENTGGQFIPASNTQELNAALEQTAKAPEPEPEPVPEITAKLIAPELAIKGTLLEIGLEAEEEQLGGYVYLYPQGKDKHIAYSYVQDDAIKGYKPSQMRLPAIPGEYELKWITKKDKQVAAEASLSIADVEISIQTPETATKGTEIQVEIDAPEGLDGYIYLYPKGKDKHVAYGYVAADAMKGYKPSRLRLPATTGEFELKWLTKRKEMVAEQALSIVDAEVTLSAPETAPKGTQIAVELDAPEGLDGYIYLFPKGKDNHIAYGYVSPDNLKGYKPSQLRLPATAGDYELKWLTKRKEVIAEKSLTLTEIEVSIEASDQAEKGTKLPVTLNAPEGLDGYIYLFPKGKDKNVSYGYVSPADIEGYKPSIVKMPDVTGDYELKWLTKSKEVLAVQDIQVVDEIVE